MSSTTNRCEAAEVRGDVSCGVFPRGSDPPDAAALRRRTTTLGIIDVVPIRGGSPGGTRHLVGPPAANGTAHMWAPRSRVGVPVR